MRWGSSLNVTYLFLYENNILFRQFDTANGSNNNAYVNSDPFAK